jgi:hypothetical protein
MSSITPIDHLIERLRAVETEIEAELARKRAEIAFTIEQHRIHFPLEVLTRQRAHRVGWWRYLRESRLLVVLTAPLIYTGFVPFALLDAFVTLYQRLCFPVYGIATVQRARYLVFDRAELPYLNWIEKFNCFYCSYANGVAAYAREVAARTEQYWCPIKHARRLLLAHEHYLGFFEFGDAQAYREGLERLRRKLASAEGAAGEPPRPPAPPDPAVPRDPPVPPAER